MKGSSWPRLGAGRRAALVALETAGLLVLPGSLLALARGHVDAAITASALATAISTARAIAGGRALEGALQRTWRAAVEATQRHSILTLRTRREEAESVPMLIDAVRETAIFEANVAPHTIALGIALAAIAAATVIALGFLWLLVGAAALALVGAFIAVSQARLRPIQEKAWRDAGELALDMRVLVEASAELRAHRREDAFAAALLDRADAVARAERAAGTWSSALALLPAGIALLALVAPVRAGIVSIESALSIHNAAEIGVLGGSGLLLALGLARDVQSRIQSAPYRRTLDAFLDEAACADPRDGRAGPGVAVPDLARAEIRFEGVSYTHRGAPHATPHDLTCAWPAGTGLAITGDNGAGKTTLALLLLGLLRPTEGRIVVGGVPLDEVDLEDYHRRVAYVPQGAFVALGASVGWHLRILAGDEVSDQAMDDALARVDLLHVLEEHTRRRGGAPRDVLAGELSGGERQRMHLARALLQHADLLVLDEPEAGLDDRGRDRLRAQLAAIAEGRRVLLIAHDASVIPPSFARARIPTEA